MKASVPCCSLFQPCLLLLTKTKPVLFVAVFFFIITMNTTSVLFLLIVCIFITSIGLYTDFYSHFASPWHLYLCIILFVFCYSGDYVITFFAEICENVNGTKKQNKNTRSAKTLKYSWDLLKLTTQILTLVFMFTLSMTFWRCLLSIFFLFSSNLYHFTPQDLVFIDRKWGFLFPEPGLTIIQPMVTAEPESQ